MNEQPEPPEPPPAPDAMSWERRISRPPELNDQTSALPLWVRPFAKPDVERRAASWPMALVLTHISMPYAFAVAVVVNALLGVPMRHMLFVVPATTIIGIALMFAAFGSLELLGWISGYRPGVATWTLPDDDARDALSRALARTAAARGFTIVWSKDGTFVSTRNLKTGARGLTTKPSEHMPLRLSFIPARRDDRARVLKLSVHAICFWDAGEAELLAALARDVVADASRDEPWIAQTATWKHSR